MSPPPSFEVVVLLLFAFSELASEVHGQGDSCVLEGLDANCTCSELGVFDASSCFDFCDNTGGITTSDDYLACHCGNKTTGKRCEDEFVPELLGECEMFGVKDVDSCSSFCDGASVFSFGSAFGINYIEWNTHIEKETSCDCFAAGARCKTVEVVQNISDLPRCLSDAGIASCDLAGNKTCEDLCQGYQDNTVDLEVLCDDTALPFMSPTCTCEPHQQLRVCMQEDLDHDAFSSSVPKKITAAAFIVIAFSEVLWLSLELF